LNGTRADLIFSFIGPIAMRLSYGLIVRSVAVAAFVLPLSSASAQVDSTSTTPSSTEVVEGTSIAATQDLTFTILASAASDLRNIGSALSSIAGSGVSSNIVVAAGGKTMSLAIPASIDVVRSGGVETVTVRTIGLPSSVVGADNAAISGVLSGGVFSAPVNVTGALGSGTLTFSIGGQVVLADTLVPGNYHGVLTVIALYN
jgi:uncharacterized membrane protein YccF (DUF307 family)